MARAAAVTAKVLEGARRRAAADYDVQLMLAFQKGDEASFRELVERNHARVIGLVHRFGITGAVDAEDLAQEVFLRIYRARHSYKPTAKFTTWMFRIASNVSLNALRARSKRRDDVSIEQLARSHDGPHTLPDPEAPAPDGKMQRTELRRQVQEAISELPEKQQMAVVLSKYEGMSYADVAQTLGCTTMAAKSLLARARENLKQRLRLYLQTGRERRPVGG
jgi:RNA polymerase sigma-70 factor (ECF subfamily)